MLKEIQEGKKREAFMREQWVLELQEAEDKEQDLERKVEELHMQLEEWL